LDGWHHIQNATVLNLINWVDFDEWDETGVTTTKGIESPSGNYDAFLIADGGSGGYNTTVTPVATYVETDEPYTISVFAQSTGSSAEFTLAMYDYDDTAFVGNVDFTWSDSVLSKQTETKWNR
jgi:hypothetical protein